MFRASLVITEDSDLEALLRGLAERLRNSGLDSDTIAEASDKAAHVLTTLDVQGAKLAGSSFSARKTISGSGYEIVVAAEFGIVPSLLQRFRKIFGM